MTTFADRGRLLEERVGDHFAAHGYLVRLNVHREGRSGGSHEIDVLAEKSDALTTFRLAVECKAWQAPIEKDAVSKLSYVLSDLGLDKGIIVALHGWRAGAEQAALELGIDLWGPAELDRLLGEAVLRQLQVGRPARLALGYRFTASHERTMARARVQGRGPLGLWRREQLAWFGPVWVPVYVVQMTIASAQVRRGRERYVTTAVTNAYEAVSGRLLAPARDPDVDAVEVDLSSGALDVGVRDTRVTGEIRRAFERWEAVQQQTAKERHAEVLASLGLPVPCRGVSVDDCSLVYAPTYLGWLRGSSHERLVAFDGASGAASDQLSQVLTSRISHVRSSLFDPAET